jgi:hypothetical protein
MTGEITPVEGGKPTAAHVAVNAGVSLPDLGRELRRAVVDLLRDQEPSCVLGVLMMRREALTVEAIAGLLGMPVVEVEWTVEMLEDEELCARITHNRLSKVVGFAAHSPRNE